MCRLVYKAVQPFRLTLLESSAFDLVRQREPARLTVLELRGASLCGSRRIVQLVRQSGAHRPEGSHLFLLVQQRLVLRQARDDPVQDCQRGCGAREQQLLKGFLRNAQGFRIGFGNDGRIARRP
jgi:hypothetical protein